MHKLMFKKKETQSERHLDPPQTNPKIRWDPQRWGRSIQQDEKFFYAIELLNSQDESADQSAIYCDISGRWLFQPQMTELDVLQL